MRRTLAAALGAALVLVSPIAAVAQTTNAPRATLTAFASEQELADLFKRWADEAQRRRDASARERLATGPALQAQAAPAPAAKAMEQSKASAMTDSESITNVQHAGVDEGGIVKVHGDHLVILRRGRLFTVAVGDLQPVAAIDAYGPDAAPQGAWYDELLISGNTIVVIGYSYARGGTEIGMFEISERGALAYKATYHLRSNDYYSSRNYASRLIGSKLVFYSPLHLHAYGPDPYAAFPAMRRWHAGAAPADFRRIAPATRIYRADDLDPRMGLALHTVTSCDLAKPELECESTAVMGAPGRVFYVSSESVYVWTTLGRHGGHDTRPASAVFRIPLDGSAPSALRTAGSPIDQFSFLEENGHLNVLVRANGRGEGMWAAEHRAGDLALLRVPLASFSDGRDAAPPQAYRPLPRPASGALQSRYVGGYLLYGAGAGWRRAGYTPEGEVFAVRYTDGAAYVVPVPHGVDRIEALGRNAVVVGSDGRDLHFSSVRLVRHPVATSRYVRKGAAQGETRSHGFFYRPDTEQDGLLGLPIVGGDEPAFNQLRRASAAVLFLRSQDLALAELGALAAQPATVNDGCVASCVDWYGNSRPLFVRGRVFALMGYELVEGRIDARTITEVRRVSFAPATVGIAR